MSDRATVPAAIAHLLAEHEAGYAVLRALQQALDAAASDSPASVTNAFDASWQALEYFERPLETHIAKEEGPLFPPLKAALPAGDRLIDEMIAEHDLIRMKRDDFIALLDEILGGHDDVRQDRQALRRLLGAPGVPVARLRQLQQAGRAISQKILVHFQNEEELVFPLAPELLDAATLDQVMEEIAAIGALPDV